MLELTFSEQLTYDLKNVAQNGSSRDVMTLHLYLEFGDIADESDILNGRRNFLEFLYSEFPNVPKEMAQSNRAVFTRLENSISLNEEIKIWVSEGFPSDMCGLMFLCSYLSDKNVSVSICLLPSIVENDGVITWREEYHEFSIDELTAFAKNAKKLSEKETSFQSNEWQRLKLENSPLRSNLSGKIISVKESFYDEIIISNFPDGEFYCAQLIGKTLIEIPGLNDKWVFIRIKKMIKDGLLTELSPPDGEHPYSAVFKVNLK